MDERLTAWLDRVGLDLMYLDQFEEPGEFEADYSGRYLAGLEDIALNESEHMGDPSDLSEPSLERAIAGYFGETLLRLAGGSWQWLEDEPAVQAEPVLDLPPVFPLRLIDRLSTGEAEEVFVGAYRQWEQAVATYRRTHPAWEPTKQYTPGVDPVPMTPGEAAHIAAWVADRERGFTAWSAEHAADGPWDFSADSLDRLAQLLQRLTPTGNDLRSPANAAFVEGATWYFGEVLRRIRGGTWLYHEPRPDQHNYVAGRPIVEQAGRNDVTDIPFLTLWSVVRGDPGAMRAKYAEWASQTG